MLLKPFTDSRRSPYKPTAAEYGKSCALLPLKSQSTRHQ